MSEEKQLTKVVFRDDDGKVETLWAFDLGENLYQLDNTPWYQYDVSWKDVIEAVPDSGGELPLFRRIVEKSGYRTLRVALDEPATDVFLDEIKQLGWFVRGRESQVHRYRHSSWDRLTEDSRFSHRERYSLGVCRSNL